MENGETVAQAAARESMEEANAVAKQLDLFGVFSLPHISQVYLMFSGELETDQISPGAESLQTGLFSEHEIPWDELAFPVVTHSLQLFLNQGKSNDREQVHTATALRRADRSIDWVDL